MAVDWNVLFDEWGVKTVTKTDKKKSAYVLNTGQRKAVEAAGFSPAADSSEPDKLVNITIWADPCVSSVVASFYLAKRSRHAKRIPEPRMGRQLISEWLQPGDNLVIGNIGPNVYALKAGGLDDDLAAAKGLIRSLPANMIRTLATVADALAPRRTTTRMEFVRNPYVVAAALLRADNRCEVPTCTRELFLRDDGTPYLEVHHLLPLSRGGADALFNVAVLCPSCHREMHHGVHGAQQTMAVLAYLETINSGGQ